MLIVRRIIESTDRSILWDRFIAAILFLTLIILPVLISLMFITMRISSPFPTVSDLLILNSCRLHFLIDHILNLFRYLGLLTEDPIGTNYTPVASGGMSHRRRRSYYIRQMLSLIHLGHEFVQLVVAVSLDLFEEIVHF